MKKRFFTICLVTVVLIALIAVLVPSCAPEERCTIEVKATLDGSPWTGAVQYTLTAATGASPITGTAIENSFAVDCGNWTCAYVSGGPSGAYFVDITPSATQSVAGGGTITFTLNFKLEEQRPCTIEVKATLCDVPWQGAVQYTLTGSMPPPLSGTSVPDAFSPVECGAWTCAYVSGGPVGAYLESITPSANQTVPGGGTITFTLNFELNQDARIQWLIWTINGQPYQSSTYEGNVCDIIDAHYKQWVDGCLERVVTVGEASWLNIIQHPGQVPVPPAMIYVVDDPAAVTKTPTPLQKFSQVPSVNNVTVQKGESFNLTIGQPTQLDAHTVWQLVKGTNYTKTINWLGISVLSQYWEPHPGVLFELVLPGPGQYIFTLQTSAMVALVGDVNPQNDSTGWSPQLNLMIMVQQ